MSASREVIARPRPAIEEAVEKAAEALEFSGTRALRVLLHAGVSAFWPTIIDAPEKQIRGYESTIAALRRRWENRGSCFADPAITARFREMDAEAVAFLNMCADRSATQWLEPAESIAAYSMSVLQGAVLRWLATNDEETMLVVFDDLVTCLSGKAIDL
ncbi:TetR family transcriptional regulator [Nocardia sp. alder85J]|uniref:TetR family transcriptional regulator n=1 Tax=Nocardia sp. alder85J TaxID=2862949 RepID=UPI001CD7B44E|nr:TetR family transcriptional regulator [Nocardia sp. alder85J]MCX4095975.1 TetR family transcriptional regulator [Nocardia sp. alder85J]